MKTSFISAKRTKGGASARVLVSMTENEARSIALDIAAFRAATKKKESLASWHLLLQLRDYFDGQAEVVPMDTWGTNG